MSSFPTIDAEFVCPPLAPSLLAAKMQSSIDSEPEPLSQLEIEHWLAIPFGAIKTVRVHIGPPSWPAPIQIDDSDLAPS